MCHECVQFQREIRKISRCGLRSPSNAELGFHVVALQRTAKKCTKNYNARAQLLFCSLNLLFGGVPVAVAVAVAVVFWVRSLIIKTKQPSRIV